MQSIMEHVNFIRPSFILTIGLISGCGSEQQPVYLGDLTFDDPYIENCVYQNEWQYDEHGEYRQVHQRVARDGSYYEDPGQLKTSDITDLMNCARYNQPANNGALTYTAAEHLRDLSKLPSLGMLILDFKVYDISDLAQLSQVETLLLDRNRLDSYVKLAQLASMSELNQLIVLGSEYRNWQALSNAKKLKYLYVQTVSSSQGFNGVLHLPMSLKYLGLSNHFFEEGSDLSNLAQLHGLGLHTSSGYFHAGNGLKDFTFLSSMLMAKQINIGDYVIDDLSSFPTEQLEYFSVRFKTGEFSDMDLRIIENMRKLRALSIRDGNRVFEIHYNDSERGLDIGQIADSSFACIIASSTAIDMLSTQMNIESMEAISGYDNHYLARDLNLENIVTLLSQWRLGNIDNMEYCDL